MAALTHPALNLNNNEWPILTYIPPHPPAKFVRDDDGRAGTALDSLVCNGVIVRGGYVRSSVLSPEVLVEGCSRVERAVLLHRCRIGRHAVVQDAILDKNVVVAEGAAIGVDKMRDRARGFVVSADGITVVAKGQVVKP